MEDGHFHGYAKGGWSLPWTWLTVKSKCLRSIIFIRPTLSWTWLTTKYKCIGLGGLPSLSALGLVYLSDPRYLDMADCQVQLLWVSHVCQAYITLGMAVTTLIFYIVFL
jgi:hypothetical protein